MSIKNYLSIKNKFSVMKKVVMMCAVVLAFAANAFAQTAAAAAAPADKTAAMAGKKPESWKNLLGLTAEQDAKMKEIGKANKEKTEALKADATMDKAQRKAKSAELKQANEADLKAVLTADQFTKYTDIQKQRKEEREKAKQGGQAPEKQ
jgi:periplasmic protein CpxP/Spy